MRGYKAFDKDFQCRGFQYRVGETFRCERVIMLREGFHFCPRALDCLNYYPLETSRFAEVEARDPVVEGDKAVTTELRVVREIPREEFARMCTGTIRENGTWGTCKRTYRAGKLHGLTQSWYASGKCRSETTYVDGKLHGTSIHWYESGDVQYEHTYDHGRPCGMHMV